jgi:hypothetical protein
MNPSYALNKTGHDRCRVCDDTGWVELIGTVKAHGVVYSRGSAPCKWCEVGKRRYARMLDLRQRPESNFGIEDVVAMDDGWPVSKEQAKAYIEAIRRTWAMPRPTEKALRNETPAEVEAKRRKAQQALEQAESEPELPPDPAPTQPEDDYDEIPF